MNLAIFYVSLALNLTIWSALVIRRAWRTFPSLFWVEMVSLATALWIFHAIRQPWWHRPAYDAEETVTMATQLAMCFVFAWRRNLWLALCYFAYMLIAFAQGIYDHTGNEVLVDHIRIVRSCEGMLASFLLACWLVRGRIGTQST